MPVYFIQEADRGVAVWRANDEAPDVFLCSVESTAYTGETEVRDRFAALVNAVADRCRRKHTADVVGPAAWIAELPCAKCDSPLAADVLHRARQAASLIELGLSPGGNYPAGCCKTRIVGVMGGRPDTPRSAVR
jgi:hypothetical protein